MRVVHALLCCLLLAPLFRAQTTSTSILGTVTDPSGAPVAGARVVATQVATQVKREDVTTSSGDFTFPLLDIGEYVVDVEKSGFKTVRRTGILLQINEKVRADVTLSLGNVSERVEVAAEGIALKTDEVSLGNVIEQRRIVELPLNGRNIGSLAVLQPGVQFGPRGGLDGAGTAGGGIPIPGQTITIVANGQRDVNQHATLDGVVATEARVNSVPFAPSPEAMEEFKVLTGSYSAEYGFNSGAQLVMVMRSGTNQLHGSVFNFLRNEKLDAEDYFQNYFLAPGRPRVPKQGLRQNQFGFVLGGPVMIPKLYDGRNQTFWLFDYEGRRRRQPGAVSTALVPSDEFRSGDFSALQRLSGLTPPVANINVVDPLTGTPFPGNIIPAARISTAARNLNSFWERPQNTLANPLSGINFAGVGGQSIDDDQVYVKIDHNFSVKDKVMGRYATNSVSWLQTPGASPQFTYLVSGRNNNLATQWIHIFTPSLLNEFRYGYVTSRSDSFNPRANTDFTTDSIGLAGIRVLTDGNRALTRRETGVPSINVQGFQGIAERDGGNGFDDNRLHQFGNNLSYTTGAHSMKGGFEYRRVSLFRGAANVPRGAFNFNNNISNFGYAAFLLGVASDTNSPEGLPLTDVRQNRVAGYFLDDWKASSRITLNLGMRWEYNTAATDVRGLWRSLEWTNGLNNPPVFVPNQIRTVYNFYKPQRGLIMPRLGLSYRLDDKTVLRAGYGIYYNVHQLNNYTILNLNPPLSGSANFVNNATNGSLTSPATIFTLSQPFGTPNPAGATSANVLNTDNLQPGVNQWSFDIQRRFAGNVILQVGYIGSRTTHMDNTVERNSPDPAFNTATSTLQSRRPYPFVNDNGVIRPLTRLRWLDNGANGFYHGLQFYLQKRMSNGLQFSIAHTWSKTIMEGYGRNEGDGFNSNTYQNPRDRRTERGRIGWDLTHNFVASVVYEIPMVDALKKGVAGAIFSGWQSNGILTLRTGFPYSIYQAGLINTANTPVRPDRIGTGYVSAPTVNRWYNPGDFSLVTCQNTARPDLCRYGNAGNGILEGPGLKQLDFSLFKNFNLTEKARLQFRSEFFNLFNTPQFGRPNNNISNALPGQITSLVQPMRQIQFGLKVLF
jgi:hypothetical protein